jgi:hypothetical protein
LIATCSVRIKSSLAVHSPNTHPRKAGSTTLLRVSELRLDENPDAGTEQRDLVSQSKNVGNCLSGSRLHEPAPPGVVRRVFILRGDTLDLPLVLGVDAPLAPASANDGETGNRGKRVG